MNITIKDYIEGRVNEQQVFDFVLAKLREQGRPSMADGRSAVCAYRGVGDARCAVGWLIADEDYQLDFEMNRAGRVVPKIVPIGNLDYEKRVSFLERLQSDMHDGIVGHLLNYMEQGTWKLFDDAVFQTTLEKFARRFSERCNLIYTLPEGK